MNLTSNIDEVGRFYLHTKSAALSIANTDLETINVFQIDNDKLKIVGLKEEKTIVTLFTMLGKQVLQTSFNKNEIKELSVPKLSEGVYLIKFETIAGELNKKVFIK